MGNILERIAFKEKNPKKKNRMYHESTKENFLPQKSEILKVFKEKAQN